MSIIVLFLGHGPIAPECLRAIIHDDDFHLFSIFTHPSSSASQKEHRESMAEVAGECGLDVRLIEDVGMMRELIEQSACDLMVSVGFLKIIPADILRVPRLGAINIHGGLLPKYRGRAPISWALLNGEKTIGITVHYMSEEVDSGDIILQHRINVSVQDTAATLYEKMKRLSPGVLLEAMRMFRHGPPVGVPQDETLATKYGKLTPDVCEISWDEPAEKVHDRVRALVRPYPGAYTYYGDKKYFVWKSMPVSTELTDYLPGQVLEKSRRGVVVGTGEGAIFIEEVQEEGGDPSSPVWEVGKFLKNRSEYGS
ncbi:MAG: methionyl-tRNA formyltransferase [Candidatus Glassbacteria bacterium]